MNHAEGLLDFVSDSLAQCTWGNFLFIYEPLHKYIGRNFHVPRSMGMGGTASGTGVRARGSSERAHGSSERACGSSERARGSSETFCLL
jgi:hypothetical protein